MKKPGGHGSGRQGAAQRRAEMPRKVVLAYSGGLDTSVILKWLQDTYGCEVITFTADIGQGEELEPARRKAKKMGVKKIFVEDLREEFVRDFVFPMFRANAVYEGEYLLGTSIARPLIAKQLVEIARKTGADAISHGATGKGNDQVRFELGAYALMPDVKVIAPWREWDLTSREKLLAYADEHGIPVDFKKRKGGGAPYSMDANLLHISYEGGVLEDPDFEPEESMWRITVSPEKAPNKPEYVELEYRRGDVVAIDGKKMTPAEVLTRLNELGGRHGVGRLDLVENRYVGMKSRGCYETPGGTILLKAHRAMESLTLDREVVALKDDLMPRYARMVYNGYWFSPERTLLQTLIDASQENVNGRVRVKLYKGTVLVTGRKSKDSLFDTRIATFDEDRGAYNQADAEGFIRLNALRMRIAAKRGRK
jgi:argininosuccinate synthase